MGVVVEKEEEEVVCVGCEPAPHAMTHDGEPRRFEQNHDELTIRLRSFNQRRSSEKSEKIYSAINTAKFGPAWIEQRVLDMHVCEGKLVQHQ